MASGNYKDLLKNRGFSSFLFVQFLGAFNDNVYKIVLSMFAVAAATDAGGGSRELSLVGAVFIIPFLLFSGYAGHLADVFNKRTVLIVTNSMEVLTMGLGTFALLSGRSDFMLFVLFLIALQSTLFSPAKYGILPEMLPDRDLSRANGLVEMTTFLAIIMGTAIGSVLFTIWKDQLVWIGIALTAIAVLGFLASFWIAKVPSPTITKPFQINPWGEIIVGIRHLYQDKPLWLTVMGMTYFWFLGALFQMVILLFGKEVLKVDSFQTGLLVTALALGIGFGSMAAGRFSGDKVELGLVPLGAAGMGVFSLLLVAMSSSYAGAMIVLIFLGFSAGIFIVPLNAFLQQRSGHQEAGRLIASSNFLSMGGVLLASGVFWICRDRLQIPLDRIILIFGFFTLAVIPYIMRILPDFLIRFILWILTHTVYKIRIVGQENIPIRGPALLVCNHISHVDGLLIAACIQRFIRFMIYRPYYEMKGLHWFFKLMKAIPVSSQDRRAMVASLADAREALVQGHLVCIFAEGAISRTGNLLPFKAGFTRIVKGLDVPIIPVQLDRLWGSIFSFKDQKFFWKIPEQLPYPATVSFGAPLPATATVGEVRSAILELGCTAAQYRRTSDDLLNLRFIQTAKRHWSEFAMADSTGKELTYGKALIGSLLLARFLRKQCAKDEMVGIMLPASVGGALSNMAVLLAGKVPVNINFTTGREGMASAIQQCNIKVVLTSRLFLAKAKLEEMEGMVFLEEIMKEMTPVSKIITAVFATVLPTALLCALYRDSEKRSDALATVIFSSGSSGAPKGIMLSHHNILANIEGLDQIFWVGEADRMMGVLPFFHSFGFTGTLMFPLLSGFGAVYHANPTDAKTIGEMTQKYKATILISTPTFYAMYMKRCTAEEFSSLRYAIVGAEKLRESVATAFKEKYGLDLLEGYGCTEMGPIVSANVQNVTHGDEHQAGVKFGTVGHPIPGVVARVVDLETGKPLPSDQEGLLLVKGPNRMIGYLNNPKKSAEVLRGDWYVTGDIGLIGEDGFIRITDRLSRFSKIGGEMVPHIKIEAVVNDLLGDVVSVVTAVPDEQKGERLVIFYVHPDVAPEMLWERLSKSDLPKLWIPKKENIHQIEALPTLGTGKTDLVTVKKMAMDRAGLASHSGQKAKSGNDV
ncbi:MAG: acyl-[ACP]--phospholipid O-acyltransferase [Nitrospirota bacterium]